VKAAELAHRSVSDEWLPTASINSNYDLLGPPWRTPTARSASLGSIKNEYFSDGGKRRADMLDASTTLKQRREELANLQGKSTRKCAPPCSI